MTPPTQPAARGPRWMQRRHDPSAQPRRTPEERQRQLEPLLRQYEQQRRAPIDDGLAVFAAYWNSAIACNPKAISDKVGELLPNVRRVWVVSKRLARTLPSDLGVDVVVARTEEYFDVLARARWFVNNVNFPAHYVKREGTVHVQTHHGTPLKWMGVDQASGPNPPPDIDVVGLRDRCARWDFSLSSNPYSTEIWRRAYPGTYESLDYGYPRNDVLATATADDVARARSALGVRPDQQVVLFAPTHREYQSGFAPTFDLEQFVTRVGAGVVLLTRTHYSYDAVPLLAELSRAGRIVDVSAHPSIERLYLAADVLVTDYSSAMFDYAVLDRPIVIHAPDWDDYRARRGTYFDLLAEPPGLVSRTDDELVDAFLSGAVNDEAAQALRTSFRQRFCPYDDGSAAERVVRRVWLDEPARPAGTLVR